MLNSTEQNILGYLVENDGAILSDIQRAVKTSYQWQRYSIKNLYEKKLVYMQHKNLKSVAVFLTEKGKLLARVLWLSDLKESECLSEFAKWYETEFGVDEE